MGEKAIKKGLEEGWERSKEKGEDGKERIKKEREEKEKEGEGKGEGKGERKREEEKEEKEEEKEKEAKGKIVRAAKAGNGLGEAISWKEYLSRKNRKLKNSSRKNWKTRTRFLRSKWRTHKHLGRSQKWHPRGYLKRPHRRLKAILFD